MCIDPGTNILSTYEIILLDFVNKRATRNANTDAFSVAKFLNIVI
jgi:hypothetical protein